MVKNLFDIKKLDILLKKLRFYEGVIIFLVLTVATGFLAITFNWWGNNWMFLGRLSNRRLPPHYQEVTKIIRPLRYSYIPDLTRKEIKISIDFAQGGIWFLRNIHRFNPDGKIILADERYGTCGELTAYTYDKIRPLFSSRYKIEFIKVAEAEYFFTPKVSHIVLEIIDTAHAADNIYIIDSSFGRYGRLDEFGGYYFLEEMDSPEFVETRNPDIFFPAGAAAPVVIRKQFLISLLVRRMNNNWDKDNFMVSLIASHHRKFFWRNIFALSRDNGRTRIIEDKALGVAILGGHDYELLRQRIVEWFSQIIE